MKHTKLFIAGMLGALMAAGVGCAGDGSDAGSQQGEDVGSADWKITQIGSPVVNGCDVSALFDITAPASIGFIAANVANNQAQDIKLELSRVDQNGQRQVVNAQTVQASSLKQSSQSSLQQSMAAHNDATSLAEHSDESTIDRSIHSLTSSQSSSSSSSSHDGRAAQVTDNSANQNASASMDAFSQFFAQQITPTLVSGGVDGLLAGLAIPSESLTNQRRAQRSDQANSAANRTNSSYATADSSQDMNAQQQSQLNESLQDLHQAVTNHTRDTSATSSDTSSMMSQEQAQEIDQALQSSNLNNQELENTLVMNTDQLDARHYVLQVTFNGSMEKQLVNVLAGAGPTLDLSSVFPQSFPICPANLDGAAQ